MRSALQKVPGVSSVQVDLMEGKAVIQAEKGKVAEDQLVNAVNKAAGMHEYSATVVKTASKPDSKPAEEKSNEPQGRQKPEIKKHNVRK